MDILMEIFLELWQLVLVVILLILGYIMGSIAERRHYKSIVRREDALGDLVVIVAKTLPPMEPAPATTLVRGSVVISVDYFKRFLAQLRMIFGGRIHTYESLLDRARREAILRMQEEARAVDASMIFNMRFETSSISKGKKNAVGTIEVLAYGTAVIPKA
jgi:uncharacterized protein YbjQ (UPF0145 family)